MGKEDWYFVASTLLGILALLGIDWKLVLGKVSMRSRKSAVLLLLAVIGSLTLSGIGWYRISQMFRYSDDVAGLRIVRHQKFFNQKVPLDGVEYDDCDFENITFLYNGTTPVRMVRPTIRGSKWVESANGGVTNAWIIMKGLGWLRPDVQITAGPENKPAENIQAPPSQ